MGNSEYHQKIGHKVEVLIVCVNYSDFLKITLPKNKKQMQNITVITDFNDKETVNICNENDVDYILTDEFYRYNFPFIKSAGYTVAFNFLHYKDWVLLIDSDVILNENFGLYIKENISELNMECIYGCPCALIKNYSDFLLFENKKIQIDELNFLSDEWLCNGYFQLFNFDKFKDNKIWEIYPQTGDGKDEDVLFRLKFGNNYIKDGKWVTDKNFQKMIDLPVIHLGELAMNYKGRKSKRFE